jgi:hypothetical protein
MNASAESKPGASPAASDVTIVWFLADLLGPVTTEGFKPWWAKDTASTWSAMRDFKFVPLDRSTHGCPRQSRTAGNTHHFPDGK